MVVVSAALFEKFLSLFSILKEEWFYDKKVKGHKDFDITQNYRLELTLDNEPISIDFREKKPDEKVKPKMEREGEQKASLLFSEPVFWFCGKVIAEPDRHIRLACLGWLIYKVFQ